MEEIDVERLALADYMASRRSAILESWRSAINRDPALNTGDSLPRVQLFDHIPAMLSTFERQLRHAPADEAAAASNNDAAQVSAAAHGLQRWQQGYGLREVTRELGKLNECVIAVLDGYTTANPHISHAAVAVAPAIEESVGQYFQLQQQEAAGHVSDLESALSEIQELEKQRADLWRQAAHDLRGNLGVVANATVGLAHGALHEGTRDDFVRILMRNVTTLHHLLDDVTSLARLEAGREQRQIEPIDVSPIFQQLCEGIRPLAQQHRLFLRCEGPPGFVSWGDCGADDVKRWELRVVDTGPGLHSGSAKPLAQALANGVAEPAPAEAQSKKPIRDEGGEGIGLSIVKRLCELLDATIELKSVKDVGTTFRILFPRKYLT
jgi:signal transduction histidine kinase